MKKLLQMIALVAVVFALVASAALADVSDLRIVNVEVNGNDVHNGEIVSVEEGETLEVEVALFNNATEDVNDVQVELEIDGYEYDDYENLEVESKSFDVEAGTSKYVDLSLDLPVLMDNEDDYYLTIRVSDREGSIVKVIELNVEHSEEELLIEDVVLSADSIEAGRSVLATVEVFNAGDIEEEDVKVTIAVPELGISSTDYIDFDEDSNEYEQTEDLYLSIPDCAAAGDYEVVVTVEYDHYESVSESYSLNVIDGEYCEETAEERLVIAVGPESQEVSAGSDAVYAIALSNEGDSTESYVLTATTGSDSVETSLTESLVVLDASESTVVYLTVSANAEGDFPVAVLVENDGTTIETISLTLSVEGGASASEGVSLRNGLEIALIVLVVLLVVVGLIVGFNRIRGSEDEEQTYY